MLSLKRAQQTATDGGNELSSITFLTAAVSIVCVYLA